MMTAMKAIEISAPGGPEMLTPTTRPLPEPGPGQVRIAVHAAGVNRPDILQRSGAYPPPPGASDLPGLEVAGTVDALGEGGARWAIGDPVCALAPGGGYAEHCVVDARHCLPIPAGFSMVEAAAVPETFFTVWHNVFERGALKAGETFLVHGGTSGIGTTAIQLAKAFGATVLTTAGSDEKCAACRDLGADHAINYRDDDFVAAVKDATDKRGADLILDMVGGDYIARNHQAAAVGGRIVQIAFLEGRTAEIDFTRLMVKRLTHTGSTLRPRSDAFKAALAEALEDKVWPLLANRTVAPVIDRTFTLDDAADAHRHMEAGAHIGKIVLTVAGS